MSDVKLPPMKRKKGRPKGGEQTVIGLGKKHKRKDSKRPTTFWKKSPKEKDRSKFIIMVVFK